jgi:hypothetical protein
MKKNQDVSPSLKRQLKLVQVMYCRMDKNQAGAKNIKEYLQALLTTLWKDKEGFTGKRPFGNSSWHLDMAKALIQNGLKERSILNMAGSMKSMKKPLTD